MDGPAKLGRVFVGIALVSFGVQYFIYGRFVGGLMPGPPWTPGAPFTAYLLGLILLVGGASIAANKKARLSATLLGILIFVCVVLLFAGAPSATLHQGGARTRALEPLALSAALWMLAGMLPLEPPDSREWNAAIDKLAMLGRYLFAFSMIVFGAQHFMYAEYIATLVTPWIPWHLFWTYFFGVAFVATGIAVAINVQARLASILLGVMFLSWVLVLHGPRVAMKLHNGDEWSSLFVALEMCGSCFIVASAFRGGGTDTAIQKPQV